MEQIKSVVFFGIRFAIVEQPKAYEESRYCAKAVDGKGNIFMIVWNAKDGCDGTGEADMSVCDWENPVEVYPIPK